MIEHRGTDRRPHHVYRLYDEGGVLLYIGKTMNVPRRLVQQACEQRWWAEVASHTAEEFPDKHAAYAAEAEAIQTEDPKYNILRSSISPRQSKANRPHVMYRAYGPDKRVSNRHRLLYVGITFDLSRRLTTHHGRKPWWRDVAMIKLDHFPNRETARAAEVRAIQKGHPIYNERFKLNPVKNDPQPRNSPQIDPDVAPTSDLRDPDVPPMGPPQGVDQQFDVAPTSDLCPPDVGPECR